MIHNKSTKYLEGVWWTFQGWKHTVISSVISYQKETKKQSYQEIKKIGCYGRKKYLTMSIYNVLDVLVKTGENCPLWDLATFYKNWFEL